MKGVLIIHGPNLNRSGYRETDQYGNITLDQINCDIEKFAMKRNIKTQIFQSNSEGLIIDKIESVTMHSDENIDAIVINPGAYTHYSYAIRDAIAASNLPCVEVHITNIYKREDFRHKSVIAPVCVGQITGFGVESYLLAISALFYHIY